MQEKDIALINLPILPLRDVVALPGMNLPLFVGRKRSINALEFNEKVFLVAQKDPYLEAPSKEDLYSVGVVSLVKELIVLPDKTLKVLTEGLYSAKIQKVYEENETMYSEIEVIERLNIDDTIESAALRKSLCTIFEQYLKMHKKFSAELISYIENINTSFNLAYVVSTHTDFKIDIKQKILEETDSNKLIEYLLNLIENEIEIMQAERRIRSRVKSQIEKNQKEYYLNEQIKAIQKELGEADDFKEEVRNLEALIKKNKLPDSAVTKAKNEIKKLKYINPASSEAGILRNYLDFFVNLPWQKSVSIEKDLLKIKNNLEASHFGMQKAKERIYELILQNKRIEETSKEGLQKSAVLCFYGSPGVGKTSLAYAAGKAMNIPVARISLGGVRDEAVLRGHRRTYIGAVAGKIMQAVKDAESCRLLIILDEIGSIGSDFRGNPEDVLLEILDPIQNKMFQDHYVEEGFDLSKVIFMATTNSLDLKPALLDRLEIIEINGYTAQEKYKIASNHIIPKLLKEHALKKEDFKITEEQVHEIIKSYTYESGVRGLEQVLAKLIRKKMVAIEEKIEENSEEKSEEKNNSSIDPKIDPKVNDDFIKKSLGLPLYSQDDFGIEPAVGISTGLAYVQKREGQEGEVLYIEAKKVPGDGKVECTGSLGKVMQESALVAFKYLISNAEFYKIDLEDLKKYNLHVHFPSGAVPKDGPSAGVAIFVAMLSVFTNKKIRSDIAITGEISLYKVLKVGGIKEKVLGAYRRNPKINTIFLPYENENNALELPDYVKKAIEIKFLKYPWEIVDHIFVD